MAGRFAVDFGTSNTVLATWDVSKGESQAIGLLDLTRSYLQAGESIPVIPSLIHYASEHKRWLGNQVLEKELAQAQGTFRWMKRYILNKSPLKIMVEGTPISPLRAAQDFLSGVLLYAIQEIGLDDEEIALTVPVESFEYYENWLASLAISIGLPRFRLIDEPSAAALGYGAHIQPGDVYLIFDFGGGTLDISIVRIEPELQAQSGQTCRVLGKAGATLGGISFDQWLFQEVLRLNGRSDADEDIRPLSVALLSACERLKEQLSFQEYATLTLPGLRSGAHLHAEFTQAGFEELLDRHEAFTILDRTIRRALNAAQERGYDEQDIKAVLMVGGSSQVPPVQRALRRLFGRQRVLLHRPLDAIARGAAAFVAGVEFYDHIQHDYAIRYVDRASGAYEYRNIVQRGTPYPTSEPVARLSVKATYEGQTRLGIAIFEIADSLRISTTPELELIFDPDGAARLVELPVVESLQRARFWMNEHNPTFLNAEPPASLGEVRFEVAFSIDNNKRLMITARDLKTGQLIMQQFPVVKLT